ncbi:larval serum protein 1 beta chain-like [Episyrphus balteatus]|uniref:larval serum protein 1 beta chain-like n=1 Tax=Episyrphus balteatus TaxID=286459 RepID=UPI002485077C|nr:larval serum protein 1 beta chain-like [Episyrphus balteatus]
MKLTLAILACVAVVSLAASVPKDLNYDVDKAYLEKQKFLFEILYRVEDPLQFEEYIKLGGKLINDQSKYQKYEKNMIQFYDLYKVGGLLPKGEYFSAVQKYHALQALGLFNYFYYAKDYETLVQNIAWARLNVNEGMFVYALTLAVIHRPDMKGLILPSIYEIFPQMTLNAKSVYQAEKFDSDVYNRQIMLEKELKSIYDQDTYVENSKQFYLKDWKTWQWWKLMGLDEQFYVAEQSFLRSNIKEYTSSPVYQEILKDLNSYYLPVDYTRDIGIFNEESKLSYFTEDIGLNGYWYYLNMYYSDYLYGQEYNLNKDRRGELWIYSVQQILARYYMERLSNGLGEIDELSLYGLVKTGYDPQLIAYNGNGFTYRKNYYELESYQNLELANRLVGVYRRIMDIIDTGKYVTKNGVEIDLTKPESIDYIGSLMQGNIDVMDKNFFGHWYALANVYLSGGQYEAFTVQPHALQNYETMLRDPISYLLFKKIIQVYYKFKNQLPSYKREELIIPGVQIQDVEVSELKTYFDLVDLDITNLLNEKMVFIDGKFVWDKTLLARQMRLNHIPYNYNIKVQSEKPQNVIVRTYIAPEFDEYDRKIDLLSYRENFMEIDVFTYDLPAGESIIKRSSKDVHYNTNDRLSYTELYKFVMLAYEGKQGLPYVVSGAHCSYPDRLALPRGWVKGMPVRLFVIISQYNGEQKDVPKYESNLNCGIGYGDRYLDNLPLGYPFDRKIENIQEFYVPNMYFKNVKIYHEDKLDKYYPYKYENYGNFDYNY